MAESNTFTRRGKGKCPSCNEEYVCRYKPEKCVKCGFHLGGTFVPKHSKKEHSLPDAVKISEGLYSVKTSNKDDRCFVVRANGESVCFRPDCKQRRSTFVANGRGAEFQCKHLDMIALHACSHPRAIFNLSAEVIDVYAGGKDAKCQLKNLLTIIPDLQPAVVRVSDKTYAVFGNPSATNPIGYCHVYIESEERRLFRCTSKGCRTFVSKSKQSRARATCLHLHVLYSLLPTPSNIGAPGTNVATESSDTCMPLSRETSIDAAMHLSIPYNIPSAILQQIHRMDAATLLNLENGWPEKFEPNISTCTQCQSPLSNARPHPGQKLEDKAYLLTELNPFKRIEILVKVCSNHSCKAMHQSDLFHFGK